MAFAIPGLESVAPDKYDATNIYGAAGIATGKGITAAMVKTIAHNNNAMIGAFSGPVGHCVFGEPDLTGPATLVYEDIALFLVHGDPTQREYIVQVRLEHTGTEANARLGIKIDGTLVETMDIPTESAPTNYTIRFDNPGTANQDIVLAINSDEVRFFGAALTRARYGGATMSTTQQDKLRNGGVHFMHTATRLAATEPFTDELVNRGFNNCRNLVDGVRHSLACLTMPIKNRTGTEFDQEAEYPWTEDAGGSSGKGIKIAHFMLYIRYPQTLKIMSCLRAPVGVTMRIEFASNAQNNPGVITPNFSAKPAGSTYDYPFTVTELDVSAGAHQAHIYIDGAGETARLYAMNIFGGL